VFQTLLLLFGFNQHNKKARQYYHLFRRLLDVGDGRLELPISAV